MAENEKPAGEKSPGTGKPQEQRSQTWLELMKVVAIHWWRWWWILFNFLRLINRQQREFEDNRMYIDMMGRREDSESALRKDMFKYILDTFMRQDQNIKITPEQQLQREVMSIELLAYNFHESLNITPLFQYVRQRIPDGKQNENFKSQLERVAVEVCERQISALSGKPRRWPGPMPTLPNSRETDSVPHLFWNMSMRWRTSETKAASPVYVASRCPARTA